LYCQDNSRPGKPVRLMCGLLILKHLRNLLDKSLVEQWSENAYYLYFWGCRSSLRLPRVPLQNLFISGSVSVRRELNLSFRIRVNNEDREDHHNNTAFIDSIEINTPYGYQFSPFVFLGAGTGLHFMSSYKTRGMEIPLDGRDSKVDIYLFLLTSELISVRGAVSARMSVVGHFILSCQKATAAAALTLSESTP